MFKIKGTYQTAGIAHESAENKAFYNGIATAFSRFLAGDYGDLCEEDSIANEQALADGSRILAVYNAAGKTIWIIADAEDENKERIVTVLFPDEY